MRHWDRNRSAAPAFWRIQADIFAAACAMRNPLLLGAHRHLRGLPDHTGRGLKVAPRCSALQQHGLLSLARP